MKRIFLFIATVALVCSCHDRHRPDPEPYNTFYSFYECIEDYYGGYYSEDTDNYLVSLATCKEDKSIYIVLDMICPKGVPASGLAGGDYIPLRSGNSSSYTFVSGYVDGTGAQAGSYLEEYLGGDSSRFYNISSGDVNVSYKGNVLFFSGTVNVDGEMVDFYFEGVPVVNDNSDPEPEPDPEPEVINMPVTYAVATNWGDWYTTDTDDWFIELYNENSKTGENIIIDILSSKIGSKTLPTGTFPISMDPYPDYALGSWLETNDKDEVTDYGGTWYIDDNILTYGATSGSITISTSDSGTYTIRVDCADDDWNGAFKATYRGEIEYGSASSSMSVDGRRTRGLPAVRNRTAKMNTMSEVKHRDAPHRINR